MRYSDLSKKIIQRIMDNTVDAYSRDRYGEKRWQDTIQYLLQYFKEDQVEWILQSKHMRWAADMHETKNGIPTDIMKLYHGAGGLLNIEIEMA